MDHPRSSQDSAPAPSTTGTSEREPHTHGGHEDATPTPHPRSQTTATMATNDPSDSGTQTTSFRKPVPFPGPIVMPAPYFLPSAAQDTTESPAAMHPTPPPAPHTPSTLNLNPNAPSGGIAAPAAATGATATAAVTPYPQAHVASSSAGAGPSTARRPHPRDSLQESDQDEQSAQSGQETSPVRTFSILSSGNGSGFAHGSGGGNGHGGNGNGNGGGNYAPSTSTSIRRPTRAVSYHDPVRHRDTDRYPAAASSVGVGMGMGMPKSLPTTPGPYGRDPSEVALNLNAEGMGAGMASPHGLGSNLDWIVPNTTARRATADGSTFTGLGHAPTRRSVVPSHAGTLVSNLEKSVGERIEPTLAAARLEKARADTRAKLHGWALNAAIGAQVMLGALTTGVAAATTGRQTSIATSILGGLSTLAASYLAKARGSGEPEWSTRRAQDLSSFLRDCEAFELDYGHKVGPEHDDMINRYRRRFEEIMGNGVEGVGDDVNVMKKKQGPAREKVNDSPV
ncbi:hypothetical protein C8Q80DRAFT_1274678 [Daedaleopsis nitida]|nr:hypothetical protein C8Q80DRAFT_1274678 [Daedaleopsis nitida]